MTMHYYKKEGQNGFAILFAVLMASVLLMVGLSIYNVSIKELVLTGYIDETNRAAYAAQSGIECALFWILKADDRIINLSNADGSFNVTNVNNMLCGTEQGDKQQNLNTDSFGDINLSYHIKKVDESSVDSSYNVLNISSSKLSPIPESTPEDSDPLTFKVTIKSCGYNTDDEFDPRRVERCFTISPY